MGGGQQIPALGETIISASARGPLCILSESDRLALLESRFLYINFEPVGSFSSSRTSSIRPEIIRVSGFLTRSFFTSLRGNGQPRSHGAEVCCEFGEGRMVGSWG